MECPQCGKQVKGQQGLKMHLRYCPGNDRMEEAQEEQTPLEQDPAQDAPQATDEPKAAPTAPAGASLGDIISNALNDPSVQEKVLPAVGTLVRGMVQEEMKSMGDLLPDIVNRAVDTKLNQMAQSMYTQASGSERPQPGQEQQPPQQQQQPSDQGQGQPPARPRKGAGPFPPELVAALAQRILQPQQQNPLGNVDQMAALFSGLTKLGETFMGPFVQGAKFMSDMQIAALRAGASPQGAAAAGAEWSKKMSPQPPSGQHEQGQANQGG